MLWGLLGAFIFLALFAPGMMAKTQRRRLRAGRGGGRRRYPPINLIDLGIAEDDVRAIKSRKRQHAETPGSTWGFDAGDSGVHPTDGAKVNMDDIFGG